MDQVGLVGPSPRGVLVDLEGLGGREDRKCHCDTMATSDDLKVPFVAANVGKRLSAVIINRTLKRSREDMDEIKLFIDTTELCLAKGVSSLLYASVCVCVSWTEEEKYVSM